MQGLLAMAQLTLSCPHCRTEKVGFAPRNAVQVTPGGQTLLFLQCEGCGQAIVAVVNNIRAAVEAWIGGHGNTPGQIVRIYPEMIALKAPADVPSTVRAAFLSGLDNLDRAGGANAAAIMFRRAVEIAIKAVNPDAPKGQNLDKRIEGLPPDIATPAMKEWAHQVRLDANEATHEPEEFSEDDAKKLRIFAEMFLTYAFTLPAMLARAKEPPKA